MDARFVLLLGVGFARGNRHGDLAVRRSRAADRVRRRRGRRPARRPYAIVAGLVASFSVFTLFAAWLLDQLGLPQDLLRNLAIALLFLVAATCSSRGSASCSSGRSRASPGARPATSAAASCSARASGSSSSRAPGRCSRPSQRRRGARRRARRRVALTLAYALGAAVPMLADRARRPARLEPPAVPRATSAACGPRSASSSPLSALALVVRRRHDAPDAWFPTTRRRSRHVEAARARVASCEARSSAASRARPAAAGADRTTARRPNFRGIAALAQQQAADALAAARQGRAGRLLDVLVHQLPAHAAAPQGLGRRVPQGRARDRRRPHARVRVRARCLERPQRRRASSASATRSRSTTTTAPGTRTRTSTGRPST